MCHQRWYIKFIQAIFYVLLINEKWDWQNHMRYNAKRRHLIMANLSKFAHVVVAGFNYGVNMADKVKIFFKYDTKITSRWSGWDVIAKDIYGKTGQKVFAMTLMYDKQEFRFVRIQLQLVFIHPMLDWDKHVLKIVYWIIKNGCVEGIVYLCVICIKVVFDILGFA